MNKLYLHKDIYLQSAVEQSVKAFNGLAEIVLEEMEDYYCLSFINCKADADITRKEFGNYVLLATIQSAGELYD